MKTLIIMILSITCTSVFAFDRIGKVIEKDTLFHYDNYDRVKFHQEREKEYNILSDRLNPIFDKEKAKKDLDVNEYKIVESAEEIPEIQEQYQEPVKIESPKIRPKRGNDPLVIDEEEDVINISI